MTAHRIFWLVDNLLLYTQYRGHQTTQTLTACLDDMANELDKATRPIFVLIDWRDVTGEDPKALLSVQGHRAYSHPQAARGVLVGMDMMAQFQNEVTANNTRDDKNTQYFKTMEDALDYLRDFVGDATAFEQIKEKVQQ